MSAALIQGRSATLDVVRGTAILAVVTIHSFQASLAVQPSEAYSEASKVFVGISFLRFGVELFYLLSGWLIFSIYRGKSSETGLQYLAKRAGRIWPLWILFTLISFLTLAVQWHLSPVDGRFNSDSLFQWLLAIGMVILFLGWLTPDLWNVPSGGWSIQVEIGHYSIFWFLRKSSELLLLVSVLFGYGTYFVARFLEVEAPWAPVRSLADSWIRLGLYGTWPFFVAGGLAFIWSRRGKEEQVRSGVLTTRLRPWLLLAIAVTAWRMPIPYGMTYEAVIACVILLAVSWLAMKWYVTLLGMTSLGRYSYFIYFMHFWILELLVPRVYSLVELLQLPMVFQFWLTLVITIPVTLLASLALAIPSWRFFESRWIGISRRVKSRN